MRAAIEVQGDLAEPNTGRALSAGLIDRVVPEADPEAEALSLARTPATRPPEALKIARDRMLGDRDTLVARIEDEGQTHAGLQARRAGRHRRAWFCHAGFPRVTL